MTTPLVAVSLKMYFDRAQSLAYVDAVRQLASAAPAVAAGTVRLAVLPDLLTVPEACERLAETPVLVGAQNMCHAEHGPFTGEVAASDLAALGVAAVEIGHAERRTIFGEDDAMVAAKCRTAARHGLVPMLCVGERERSTPEAAAAACVSQARTALDGVEGEVWLAYEPFWAIGAPEPAPASYVAQVCELVRAELVHDWPDLTLVYGGSAGPGLLTELGSAVDGLFLGRFAHDPAALAQVVDEAAARGQQAAAGSSS